jgi:hypothetical protein
MLDNDVKTASAARRIAREKRSAAKRATAAQLWGNGANLDEIGGAIGLSRTRVAQILAKAKRLAQQPTWHDKLTVRALNRLRSLGIDVDSSPEIEVAHAVAIGFSRHELMAAPNFGKGALAAIRAWLASHGMRLRESATEKQDGQPLTELAV